MHAGLDLAGGRLYSFIVFYTSAKFLHYPYHSASRSVVSET